MKQHSETVQVTNVKGTEISVEGVVEKNIVHSEVDGRTALACGSSRLSPSCSLAWGLRRIQRVRERRS